MSESFVYKCALIPVMMAIGRRAHDKSAQIGRRLFQFKLVVTAMTLIKLGVNVDQINIIRYRVSIWQCVPKR